MLFLGDDWAEAHHDIELQDEHGKVLKRRRLLEGVTGLTQLHELIADHLDDEEDPESVLVGIETDRGGWVHALIAAGYTVYAINPKQAARYRERLTTSGAKSDPGAADVLAESGRPARDHHRGVAGESELAGVDKIGARTPQPRGGARARQSNQLRARLRWGVSSVSPSSRTGTSGASRSRFAFSMMENPSLIRPTGVHRNSRRAGADGANQPEKSIP